MVWCGKGGTWKIGHLAAYDLLGHTADAADAHAVVLGGSYLAFWEEMLER